MQAAAGAAVATFIAVGGGCDQDRAPSESGSGIAATPMAVSSNSASARSVRLEAVELAAEDPMIGGQFVVLVNRGTAAVDVSCWSVASRASGGRASVVVDRLLASGGAYRLFVEERALLRSRDRVRLLDRTGRVVDRTRWLRDDSGDDRLWYRSKRRAWAFGRGFAWPSNTQDGRLVSDSSC